MRGCPEVAFVVNHQVNQLALVVKVSGNSNYGLIPAHINAVDTVLFARGEQNLLFLGIQQLIYLIGNGEVIHGFIRLHIEAVNNSAVLCHVQSIAV